MNTILPRSVASIYTIRIGGDDCRVRGYEIEPIAGIFSDPRSSARKESTASPWEDLTGPDELVAERMVPPPAVRKRARLVASRAILLGSAATR